MSAAVRVSLVTLGCARNEVDSSEIAGRLESGGHQLVETDPDIVVVNTCAFVASAKKDSIDTLLAAAETGAKVVAVGCLAERYGEQLARELPEADAVLGFDAYPELAQLLGDVVGGHRPAAHTPVDRRNLLPLTPVDRPSAAAAVSVPGHDGAVSTPESPLGGRPMLRKLLRSGPVAPLKIASGCDRRCTFCAIPSFRGSFVSRPAGQILDEAHWLAAEGIREVVLVSENSTSYGKDLPGQGHLEALLGDLAAVPGIDRVRLSYLQPAETRPSLVTAIGRTPGVADYFDMSFQHASPAVLRRMRRFGGRASFLDLIASIREVSPEAGIRSNVIVGFPGETPADVDELEAFLTGARLDAVGVFGYSDEDGTAAERLDGKLDDDEIAERVERVSMLVDELTAQRAEDRVGTSVSVLVESTGPGDPVGRAAHQAPEVDGVTTLTERFDAEVGDLVLATVVDTDGVDLIAAPVTVLPRTGGPGVVSENRQVSVVNLPNALTLTRLLLVPLFLVFLFSHGGHDTSWRLLATLVFAVAAITDRYDGRIARKRGLVTNLGKVADPIADKALTGAALVGLSILGDLPWWVTVVILVREVGITLLRLALLRYEVIPASPGGKLKTLVQIVAIGLYLLPLPEGLDWVRVVVMAAAVVLTAATGIDYIVKSIRIVLNGRQPARSPVNPGVTSLVAALGLDEQAVEALIRSLTSAGRTVGVAESLTGGLVTAVLTAIPGASHAVRGGLGVYATELKSSIAGVDRDLLRRVGAVHPEVARQLAGGARTVLGADWGIGITGVAGPEPQDGQAVGTVFCAVAGPASVATSQARHPGDRERVRAAAVRQAIDLLTTALRGEHEPDTRR